MYIIRHAESDANILERKNQSLESLNMGELGAELSQEGKKQATYLSQKLKGVSFDAIFASDLLRAKHTAEILKLERNLEIQTTKLIREIDYGKYRLTYNKVKNHVREGIAALEDSKKMKFQFEDMETEEHAVNRLIIFLKQVAVRYAGKTVAIVSHGRVMRILLIKLGFCLYADLPSGSIENTGYFIVESNGANFSIKETSGIYKKSQLQ